MMTDWKIGDLVELKSGGPCMTIKHVDPDGRAHCHWFNGNQHDSDTFPPETLKPWVEPAAA